MDKHIQAQARLAVLIFCDNAVQWCVQIISVYMLQFLPVHILEYTSISNCPLPAVQCRPLCTKSSAVGEFSIGF